MNNTPRSHERQWEKRTLAKTSFGLTYLKSYSPDRTARSFDVDLTKAVLEETQRGGRDAGLDVIRQFSGQHSTTIAKRVLTGAIAQDASVPLNVYDEFIFDHSAYTDDRGQRRSCYNDVMRSLGIRLPFDKSGMLTLLQAVRPDYVLSSTNTFENLREFVWHFVSSTWPLFDASVLHIPLQYFRFERTIDATTMRSHLAAMSDFGLERLMSRLIVLRAICGNEAATDVALNHSALEMCQYTSSQMDQIRFFLRKEEIDIQRDHLRLLAKNNPIERASYLVMYLMRNRTPYDFLQRVVDIYCNDPTTLRLIDWDLLLPRIEASAGLLTPELVAVAAILCRDGVLNDSRRVRSLYVPTGAAIDIFNYAKYCREQKLMTAHQFFRSFSRLDLDAQRAVFFHLLEPGVMDMIANVFPSETSLLTQITRNDAVNALSLKLDCIEYLRTRGIIKGAALRAIEDSTRQRLRQIKYETNASSGRIRLSETKLQAEVSKFLDEHWPLVLSGDSTSQIDEETLRLYLVRRRKTQFSERLTHHICFDCRVAFDYLLSNMRHNFLRFKLESAIDKAFHLHDGVDVSQFKTCIKPPLDEFNSYWLTISRERSFFRLMAEDILKLIKETTNDVGAVAVHVTHVATTRFERLLQACRAAWISKVQLEVDAAVSSQFDNSRFRSDSGLKDALLGELKSAFEDSEGWLTVNDSPIEAAFGLKELFIFESVNFSSAKTRRKPFSVQCFLGSPGRAVPTSEITVAGALFDAMVQLVHNLLENAFAYSGLAVANTAIDVSIYAGDDMIRIEFRNKFDPDKRVQIEKNLRDFSEKLRQASQSAGDAPRASSGTGLKRIYFELYSVMHSNFSMRATNREFGQNTFLVICTFGRKGTR